MSGGPDLDAYFARIGYDGPRTRTVDTLHGIALAHVQAVPFENVDVLLGRGISLDPGDVFRKVVTQGRGGYCFEVNGLLLDVLLALGFDARPVSARVRLSRPRDFVPPRTHVMVRVEADGASWLVDVGVGGLSPTAALRLEPGLVQETPHEPRRLIVEDGRTFHQALLGDEWADVWESTLEEMPRIDREVANWYTSAHPASAFRARLLVARATPRGRLTLLNRALTVRDEHGARTETVADPDALLAVLRERFGIPLPAGTRLACEGLDWGSVSPVT